VVKLHMNIFILLTIQQIHLHIIFITFYVYPLPCYLTLWFINYHICLDTLHTGMNFIIF